MPSFSVHSRANLLTWVRRNGVQIFPLADGSLLIAAEELGISDILTIDSDYSIYRTANGRALRNVLRT